MPAPGKPAVARATLVGGDLIGDVPSRPFGDSSEYTWAPNGKTLVMSARKADRAEPWSTNFDLYQVNADGSGKARNLTADNPANDSSPAYSPDGRYLSYSQQRIKGFYADRMRLMLRDRRSNR